MLAQDGSRLRKLVAQGTVRPDAIAGLPVLSGRQMVSTVSGDSGSPGLTVLDFARLAMCRSRRGRVPRLDGVRRAVFPR